MPFIGHQYAAGVLRGATTLVCTHTMIISTHCCLCRPPRKYGSPASFNRIASYGEEPYSTRLYKPTLAPSQPER